MTEDKELASKAVAVRGRRRVSRRQTDGIVAELLLKAGYGLTEPVDLIEAAGVELHSVAGGQLLLVS